VTRPTGGEADDVRRLVTAAARRVVDEATPSVRRCRETRAALRPDIASVLDVSVRVDGSGRVRDVRIRPADRAWMDWTLDRCVRTVIQNLRFFDTGTTLQISIDHQYKLGGSREAQKTKCSPTSGLPLPVRRGIWRARLAEGKNADDVYLGAKQSCELATWTDRRTLLELVLLAVPNLDQRLAVARRLDWAGEEEAAKLIRRETIRSAGTPEELARVRAILIGDEPSPGAAVAKAFQGAASDEAKVSVVRRFLAMAPHDSVLRRTLFVLLEGLGKKDELVSEILAVRADPFADVAILADGASALRRIGRDAEGRKAFGELIERAPYDPFVRAYVGDRLRAERLFDDATAAYESFGSLLPSDPTIGIRLGLAHAGAGRLDVAARVLDRVAQTGGTTGDARTGELGAVTAAVLFAEADKGLTPAQAAAIVRRAMALPLPDVAGIVLVRAPVVDHPVETRLVRTSDAKSEAPPDLDASAFGLSAIRLERGDRDLRIRLRRAEAFASRPAAADVSVLLFRDHARPELMTKKIELRADGRPIELRWDGHTLL
jgi:hypothetical protein